MKRIKVFIISFNNIPTDFWKQHVNFRNAELLHWKNPEQGFKNLNIIRPDILIIDGYFSKEPYEPYLKEALSLRSNKKIFCLTPLPKSFNSTVFIDNRLIVSRLDDAVINSINISINPILGESLLNLTG